MGKKDLKKAIVFVVCLTLIFTTFSGFSNYRGFGNLYFKNQIEIFEDANYSEIIGEHLTNGIEHGYMVSAKTEDSELIPMVFNGEVRGVYTVGSMIEYAKEQGYTVVAAINGDIYDTASGTPKGLVIHDGNIVTSGYQPDRVIAFSKDGRASLKNVSLAYSANSTIEYQISEEIFKETEVPIEVVKTVTETAIDENGVPYEVTREEIETIYEQRLEPETIVSLTEAAILLDIDFFNVPHGEARGLHLYNRHYATSTRTSGICAEAVIEAQDVQLGVNKTIKGIVKSVSRETSNTPISGSELVLSTVLGSKTYDLISSLKVGSEIEISVKDKLENGMDKAKEAIGFYYSLVEEGRNVTNGTNINPRSALGIKSNGELLLLEIDGRQATHSRGLGLTDLAEFMRELDCEYAVNLDGGGSSVLYVRQPGVDDKALRVSMPSENSERKVSNAILLAYKNTGNHSRTPENLHIYPNYPILMPGASTNFSTYASNSYFEKANPPQNVSYDVDKEHGYVDEKGVFTASDNTGMADIFASSGKLTGESKILITDEIVFSPSVSQLILEAGEVRDIGVSAAYGSERVSVPVITNDSLFTWSCDENIGTIDQSGIFTAVSSTAQEGNIYITYKNVTKTIPVKIGANVIIFADTSEHWAKEPIGVLATIGYLSGMGDNLFEPDGQLTRAQFVAMLAKMTPNWQDMIMTDIPEEATWIPGAEISGEQIPSEETTSAVMNFTDITEIDWYYDYIKWGYENNIVNGMGDGTFAPNLPITREQMAVMLCNYSIATDFILPQVTEPRAFTDQASISPWAADFVHTVAGSGIINGFENGEFLPQGVATRAQAAKVIYGFCELKGIL